MDGNGGNRRGRGTLAVLAALLASACGPPGSPAPAGPGRRAAPVAGALALEEGDGLVRTVRPGGEVVLRFSRPLDAVSARGAVRVEDETRSRAPVPVEAEARDRDLVLRARGSSGWRPGAILGIRIAGLPSLSALRAAEGDALPRDAVARVQVRSPRRTDRVPPTLLSSEPADGSAGADPAEPLVLRFSEPMDVRSFEDGAVPGRGTVRLMADGSPVRFRAWVDRTRTELTLLPETPFPPSSAVEVILTDRVRDAGGNPLSPRSARRVAFLTAAAAPADGAGRIVETFEDRTRMDPLGTTARWNDPAAPGVLSGVVEPAVLETAAAGDAALLLDPRGGTFRVLVAPAEIGDENRILKGIQLVAAPGASPGELLEPSVRVAPAPALLPTDPAEIEALPWTGATEDPEGAPSGGAFGCLSLPFRHPVACPAGSGVLVEVRWKGTAGTVLLRAARHPEPRCGIAGVDQEPVILRIAPVLRLETVGRRAAARSAWLDAGAAASWMEPRIRPGLDPARAVIHFQGAPGLPDASGPDASRATPWSEDRALLEGSRWIRFRVLFPEAGPLAPPAVIDEIALPFVAR